MRVEGWNSHNLIIKPIKTSQKTSYFGMSGGLCSEGSGPQNPDPSSGNPMWKPYPSVGLADADRGAGRRPGGERSGMARVSKGCRTRCRRRRPRRQRGAAEHAARWRPEPAADPEGGLRVCAGRGIDGAARAFW